MNLTECLAQQCKTKFLNRDNGLIQYMPTFVYHCLLYLNFHIFFRSVYPKHSGISKQNLEWKSYKFFSSDYGKLQVIFKFLY